MDITGKWKIKEFRILSPDGMQTFTPQTLPDSEDFEDFAKMIPMLIEFTPDGKLNTLVPVWGDMIEEARNAGLAVREAGFAVTDSTDWKESDGKFYYNTNIEGEFLGDVVDPFSEIKVTEDGCLLYSFDMLLMERA
ncbi:MAG: hypothetical protein SOZ93_04850 [Eubacteriales bacterium]|nr:hypothetical protein [Clostridiales bacterium]MDD6341941.1 hypothetical protein [Eubacteriales bacterium]MDD7393894.1 hypothetical protein [Eubacteriales bacterium]MDY3760635.1 hypothetical protein [Eubacteriales bacterium]